MAKSKSTGESCRYGHLKEIGFNTMTHQVSDISFYGTSRSLCALIMYTAMNAPFCIYAPYLITEVLSKSVSRM
jgi:hypothetical protein